MYASFFRFKENPFNLTPDPRYLFLSDCHEEALDHLLYGINERKGFIVITGGIGTGKTTLCRVLLDHLDTGTKSALIFNSFLSDLELLKTVNQEFGIRTTSKAGTKKEYIDDLNQFLLSTFRNGGNAFLLIDEAQNLSHGVLEQIRMLSNLETTREKLIQIVLVGQPELNNVLAEASIRQLNERVMVRYHLESLAFKEIHGYIEHRMVVAGGRGDLSFTKGAFRQIYAYSDGNPRRINKICDRALIIAYAEERHTISKKIFKKASQELRVDPPCSIGLSWGKHGLRALLLLLLVIVAGFGGWSYRGGTGNNSSVEREGQIIENRHARFREPIPAKEDVSLFLDDQASLSGLFALFSGKTHGNGYRLDENRISLVSFDMDPEYYVILKKPFRVCLAEPITGSSHILIRETMQKGAVVIDADGNERRVSRDFIMRHWGRTVSWIYLPNTKNTILLRGMRSPDVLEIQRILIDLGYMVEPTGIYDQITFQEIMRFQEDFGLLADGIAGPRTRALLYQMVK